MDDAGSTTTTHTRLGLAHAIDRELVRLAQEAPGEQALRAREELQVRHAGVLDEELAALPDGARSGTARAAARRALQQAIDGFVADRGAPFADYARAKVRGALRRAANPPELATAGHLRTGRFLQVRVGTSELEAQLGRTPRLPELADHLGHDEGGVIDAFAVRSAERVRTSQLAARFGGDASSVAEALGGLDERTRLVLHGLRCEGRSRRDIATRLGLSTIDVGRLEQHGLQRLREAGVA